MMPDRFADGGDVAHQSTNFDYRIDRTNPGARHGGTLKGISDHLDYLEELGVTAVWLTPVLENDMPGGCYHGYATTDYYRVDPRFGSNDDYRRLISECHSRGIKVVMDMISTIADSTIVALRPSQPRLAQCPADSRRHQKRAAGKFDRQEKRRRRLVAAHQLPA